MIRRATPDDIETLVAFGAELWQESPRFRRMTYNPGKVRAMLAALVGSPRGFVAVEERAGAVQGAMVAAATEHWAADELVAFDLALYVRHDKRGGMAAADLLRAYAAWVVQIGAVQGIAGISTQIRTQINLEKLAQLYRAVGFAEVGPVFDAVGV